MFPVTTRHTLALKLTGKPDSYTADYRYPWSISSDGRWILYVHVDRAEADLMLVEGFR